MCTTTAITPSAHRREATVDSGSERRVLLVRLKRETVAAITVGAKEARLVGTACVPCQLLRRARRNIAWRRRCAF